MNATVARIAVWRVVSERDRSVPTVVCRARVDEVDEVDEVDGVDEVDEVDGVDEVERGVLRILASLGLGSSGALDAWPALDRREAVT